MTSIFGNYPLLEGNLNSLIELGLQRLQELRRDGFETNQLFAVDYFTDAERNGAVFSLTSIKSGTNYGFVVRAGSVMRESVQVGHVATCGNMLDQTNWHLMTLIRGDRNQVIVRPGW